MSNISKIFTHRSVTTVIAKDVTKIAVIETPDTFESSEITENLDKVAENVDQEKLEEKVRIEKSEDSEENTESIVVTPVSEAKTDSDAGNEEASYNLGKLDYIANKGEKKISVQNLLEIDF